MTHYRAHYWRNRGISVLIRHLSASWPYVVAGIVCYRRVWTTRQGLIIYSLVLAATTVVACLIYLGIGLHLDGPSRLIVSFAQAVTLVVIADKVSQPLSGSD